MRVSLFILLLFVECQALGWGSRHTVVSTLLRVSLIWNRDINSVITPINIQLQLCWLLCRKGPPLHQNLYQGLRF